MPNVSSNSTSVLYCLDISVHGGSSETSVSRWNPYCIEVLDDKNKRKKIQLLCFVFIHIWRLKFIKETIFISERVKKKKYKQNTVEQPGMKLYNFGFIFYVIFLLFVIVRSDNPSGDPEVVSISFIFLKFAKIFSLKLKTGKKTLFIKNKGHWSFDANCNNWLIWYFSLS